MHELVCWHAYKIEASCPEGKGMERKQTLKRYYQDWMYGQWREGEKVSYCLEENHVLRIQVEAQGKKAVFTTKLFLPDKNETKRYPNGSPFLICMHPIAPKEYALKQGYAVIELDTYQIASDDCKHNGIFYDLYPYTAEEKEQTGVLMAWAWGASKVLDAVYGGLGTEVNLDPEGVIVTGVSRWGKATAVCGAFDERMTMTVPTCSGAGGLALYEVTSEGRAYDFTKIGGPAEYTYTTNEPLSCLQSEAERGWFNDRFLTYTSPEEIPYGQQELVALAADEERFYFILAACMGEDWVNAPAMWECYKRAAAYYEKNGLQDHLAVHFHKEGHAVIEEDMELLLVYFDYMKYQIPMDTELSTLQTSVFDK